MNQIQVFNHPEFGQHAVRTDERGNAVFVLSPVAKVLGYRDAEKVQRNLDRDEYWLEVVDLPTPERGTSQVRRRALVISESGLYHLIFTSTKPEAKQFRRWVTEELLPTVRKAQEVGIDVVYELTQQIHAARLELAQERQQSILMAMDYEDQLEEIRLDKYGRVLVKHGNGRLGIITTPEALAEHRRKVASKAAAG
jgi:prophage antirepressor-like protein